VYTPNLHIKKAVTPEKTMGYGFSSLEKILFYNKLTLVSIPLTHINPLRAASLHSIFCFEVK